MLDSPFLDKTRWIDESDLVVDAYPVSKGHTLIVPKRLVVMRKP